MAGFSGRITDAQGRLVVEPLSGQWTETEGGLWLAIEGKPRFGAGHSEPTVTSFAARVAESYRQDGLRCLEALRGDFALVLVDATQRRVIGAVDRFGQRQLYHATHGNCLGVACGPEAALTAAGLGSKISHQGLFHYLYFHMVPAPGTLFQGLGKLPAAHAFVWAEGHLNPSPYWVPRFEEPESASGAELRGCLDQAVRRVSRGQRVGAFLSGGLDSSTVSGMLAGLFPGQTDTFSIGFEAPGYDEMEYARIASRHFGTRAHEYYVTPEDVVSTIPAVAAAYGEPFGNSSALPAYFCARMAAEAGIVKLLAGDGGDELFAGNERYAKQGVFELWYRIPAQMRARLIRPVVSRLPSRPGVLGKARSYVAQAEMPLPDRMQSYNHLHRIELREILTDAFLDELDLDGPLDLQREIYRRPRDASTLNRMMYLDWQITLADNDLRKVVRMCELAGVDVAFPMLDDDLVDYSLRVPSRLKLKRGQLRHFYKEALKDFLPREIIQKKKHGFGLPFGVWMQDYRPLRELAYDSLARLKGRSLLRPAFIDRLIDLHREEHAAYYGELVWVLMMLDLWLEAHFSGRPQPELAPSAGSPASSVALQVSYIAGAP